MVQFIYDGITLTSNLLEGDFFKYEEIIPKDMKTLELNRKELEDNLKFMYIHSKDNDHNLITMTLGEKIFKFECNTPDSIISTDIEVESNLEFEQTINNKYLIDALKVIKSDNVNYNFTSTLNPMTFSDEDSIHLILPVRLLKGGGNDE